MCNIVIYQSELKAVARAMAIKDIRHYLNGVMIETNGADFRLVATDGHRIHIVTGKSGDMPTQEVTQYILPDTIVKTIIKARAPRSHAAPMVCLTLADGKVSARLPDGTESIALLVEGKYPDYRRIYPAEIGEVIPATLNPEYALDAYDSLRDYMRTSKTMPPRIGIATRGDSVAILSHEGFAALIMPIRSESAPICSTIAPLAEFQSMACDTEKAA